LRITAALYRRKARDFAFTPTKTRKSDRMVMLAPIAIDALRAHKVRQNQERLALGDAWQDNDLVFPLQDGTPLDGQSVTRYEFRRLLSKAGLPRIRFREMCHTFATLMGEYGHEHGVGHKDVSAVLGPTFRTSA
jgi:integrase